MNVNIFLFGCESTTSKIHDSVEFYLQTKNTVLLKVLVKKDFYATYRF